MIVHELTLQNFMGLRHIHAYLFPGVTEIIGSNRSGKSRLLAGIAAAVGGARKNVPDMPVTHGLSNGSAEARLGGITARRTWTTRTGKSGKLTVEAEDGASVGQAELDEFWRPFNFDPGSLKRASPAQFISALQELAGPEFVAKMQGVDARIEAAKAERKLLKRDLKKTGTIAPVEKVEAMDIGAVADELNAIREFNQEQRGLASALENTQRHVRDIKSNVEELRRRLASEESLLRHALVRLSESIVPCDERDDGPLIQKMAEASKINAAAAAWTGYQGRIAEQSALAKDVNVAESKVETLNIERATLAESAKLPIDGLAWNDDGVTLGGVPIGQLSTGEMDAMCVRLCLAKLPELGLLFIREGGLMDQEMFDTVCNVVAEEANQQGRDIQVLVETVARKVNGEWVGHEGNHARIVIEAGEIVSGGEEQF